MNPSELYDMYNDAANFYYDQLQSDAGKEARLYLQSRKIAKTWQSSFALGYAPDGLHALYDHLLKTYSAEDLQGSGLFWLSKDNAYIDLFRNRVIFPITENTSERIIAFGGRTLDQKQPAKYINSPETDLYKKSKSLYAYYSARERCKSEQFVILVEGFIDLISLHQFQIFNSVASCGTALSDEQIELLKQLAPRLIMIYDSDEAGTKAAVRNIEPLLKARAKFGYVQLPPGTDPAEFINTTNRYDFMKLVVKRLSFVQYLYNIVSSMNKLRDADEKANFTNKIIKYICMIPDSKQADFYVDQLASLMHTNSRLIRQQINK